MFLLAQAPAAGNNANPDAGAYVLLFSFVGGIIAVVLIPVLLYHLTLSKALARCRPENQTMTPGMVWLNLIPLFNIVWYVVVISRVAESLRNEYRSRGMDDRGDFGWNTGLAYYLLPIGGIIPCLGPIFAVAALVCFIWHWVDIASYSRALVVGGDRWDTFDYDADRDWD